MLDLKVYTCRLLTFGALTALLLLIACSSDDPAAPEAPLYPWPDTRDGVMENFVRAYGELDLAAYDDVLHADFRFVFGNDLEWDRAEDLASTARMFAGEPGLDEYGHPREGVSDIWFQSFARSGDWTPTGPDHPRFPDAERAIFHVDMAVYLDSGENTLSVRGRQVFYVRSETVADGGVSRRRWSVLGHHEDLGRAVANESLSWSALKALYR